MQHFLSSGAVPLEDHRFPCPTCGSGLRFNPATDGLKCDHCGYEEPVKASGRPFYEIDLREAIDKTVPEKDLEEIRVVRCTNCGAEIEFDSDLHAKECPFCASPLVADTGLSRQIKPQAQLPFLVSEDEARAAMNRWLGRLWFAPSNLRDYARSGRAMQGMYVPYWTYDAETQTDYTGQRGRVYYETRQVPVTVNGRRQMSQQQVARVEWRPAQGRVARRFDDVLVLGSKSLPKNYTDALAPWDLSALVSYEPRYLAGFRAEGYTVPVEDAYGEAKSIMNGVIEQDVRADIGGDQQKIGQLDTKVGRLTFKHVLLPVWLAAYKYRGKTFRFVINGRTATVEGERPYSYVKIGLLIAAMIALALLFAALQIGPQLNGGYSDPDWDRGVIVVNPGSGRAPWNPPARQSDEPDWYAVPQQGAVPAEK